MCKKIDEYISQNLSDYFIVIQTCPSKSSQQKHYLLYNLNEPVCTVYSVIFALILLLSFALVPLDLHIKVYGTKIKL